MTEINSAAAAHASDTTTPMTDCNKCKPSAIGAAAKRYQARLAGFSLIELLIVIAIIGIVAAIGYPSYTSYAQQSRRADAQLALLSEVQAMERCKSTSFAYTGCSLTRTKSPEEYYKLKFDATPTASKFKIVAEADGPQKSDTACASITIDELGVRAPAECWN